MLYVSSRSKTESFTAYRALHNEYAPDGGVFIPFNLPVLTQEQLHAFRKCTFTQNVAQLLEYFFSSSITDWDVECCIGRAPFRLNYMPHRLTIVEGWHNPQRSFAYIEQSLYHRMTGMDQASTLWASIAIRICVLISIFSQLDTADLQKVDIAVETGDFSLPIAAWYARKMGLPIGTIICTCSENSNIWDLIQRGECNTADIDVNTSLGLEYLICETLGTSEALRFLSVCQRKGIYQLQEEFLSVLNAGLSAAVVGKSRIKTILRSLYSTNNYIGDPTTALVYGGLQDHRACNESRDTIILSNESPLLHAATICEATGVSIEELTYHLNISKE